MPTNHNSWRERIRAEAGNRTDIIRLPTQRLTARPNRLAQTVSKNHRRIILYRSMPWTVHFLEREEGRRDRTEAQLTGHSLLLLSQMESIQKDAQRSFSHQFRGLCPGTKGLCFRGNLDVADLQTFIGPVKQKRDSVCRKLYDYDSPTFLHLIQTDKSVFVCFCFCFLFF